MYMGFLKVFLEKIQGFCIVLKTFKKLVQGLSFNRFSWKTEETEAKQASETKVKLEKRLQMRY